MADPRSFCRHCGVRIRLVRGMWVHSWPQWQAYWCKPGGQPYAEPLATHAEPIPEPQPA